MNNKTLAIDFDGTICKKQAYGLGVIWQKPNEGAVEHITKLRKDGYNIVIYTVRLSPDRNGNKAEIETKRQRIADWMELYEIPYDDIVGYKPDAIAYIDDRAIRFTNWQDVSNYFI